MRFDPLVANPGRLRILTALAGQPRQAFVELRNQTGLTDGNRATHARRLQSAGLVTIEKSIAEGKPLTTLHLTPRGREALADHVQSLIEVLRPAPRIDEGIADIQPDNDEEPEWVD